MNSRLLLSITAAGLAASGLAYAQTDVVAGNHTVSEHWTLAGSPYRLKGQVYFTAGSSLTIDAGVIVASLPADQGSLAICKGAQIFVNGTQSQPVIMTSTNDVATWTGTIGANAAQIPGDPKTGTWREAVNEWGNLTLMGAGYISANNHGVLPITNVPTPNASNTAPMEGLVAGFPGDTRVVYGGGNDDDDSGSISYLSLRYGGKVIGLANELNGLSLGAIGRGTDIHHVDIMNNVDDGVEIWGGAVNLKYFDIWNIGDDSFDVDEGWRGKAQFGLIVQGYSADAAQGSGVGDNCLETDGAEDADWQPVTTATIYNFTVIGQPVDGDQGTAWRDNARVQYRNCIFMDLGEELVKLDNVDGDGGHGYGFGGTLTWANTWTTAFNAVPPHANDPANPALFYTSQTSGKLAEITDSVFFRNLFASAYTQATTVGVMAPASNNVLIPGFAVADRPIRSITRGAPVVKGGKTMLPVIGLDPRPVGAAQTSVASAPNDGFFTPASYRGAFTPNGESWLCGWTAANAFGFTTECAPGTPFCFGDGIDTSHTTSCPCGNVGAAGRGCANSVNASGALLAATGSIAADTVQLNGSGMPAAVSCIYLQGNAVDDTTFGDGVRCTGGSLIRLRTRANVGGASSFPDSTDTITLSARGGVTVGSGEVRYYQTYYRNSAAAFCPPETFNVTNGWIVTW